DLFKNSWGGPNDFDVDPLFRDPGADDYSLSAFSPAIEVGIMEFEDFTAPSEDITGKQRPLPPDSNPDLGAYEAGATISVALPQEETIVAQDASFEVTLTTQDLAGNPAEDGIEVEWEINPDVPDVYLNTDATDSVITGGQAVATVVVSASAMWGLEVRVVAVVDHVVTISSGSFFVGEKIVAPPPPPENMNITPGGWTQNNKFTITWDNPDWIYGIMGAYYQVEGGPTEFYPGDDIDHIDDIQLANNGEKSIRVWLLDGMDREDKASSGEVWAMLDDVAPHNFDLVTPDPGWYSGENMRFEWQASNDNTSGLEGYDLHIGGEVYFIPPDSSGFTRTDFLPEEDIPWSVRVWDLAGNERWANSSPTTIQIDRMPPDISHNPMLSATLDQAAPSITVITEDSRSGLDRVELYYRVGGQEGWQTIDVMVSSSYSIHADDVTTRGVEYRIEAEDVAGNVSFLPDDREFYSIIVTVPGDGQRSADRWPSGVPSGKEVTSYQMLSFPIIPSSNSAQDILVDDLGDYDDTVWRFFTYANGEYIEFPQIGNIEAGR
ncbi:MAG: hypothetical protein QF551_08805, partial [Candidatus Marinimicrobia bacterium]|nr:hypothetical protein [Candidatus Neomarinimicrobiota bacterium]